MAAGAFSRRKGKRPLMPMVDGVEAREANVTRGLFHCCGRLDGAERVRNRLRSDVAQRSGRAIARLVTQWRMYGHAMLGSRTALSSGV